MTTYELPEEPTKGPLYDRYGNEWTKGADSYWHNNSDPNLYFEWCVPFKTLVPKVPGESC